MLYRFVMDGGPWVAPVLVASVAAFALALDRVWFWLSHVLSTDAKLRRRLLQGDAPPPASAPIGDAVAHVLAEARRSPEDLTLAESHAQQALRDARDNVTALELAGSVAAVLGLLGTTLATRDAFAATTEATRLGAALARSLHPLIGGLAVFAAAILAAAFFRALASQLATRLGETLEAAKRVRAPRAETVAQEPVA